MSAPRARALAVLLFAVLLPSPAAAQIYIGREHPSRGSIEAGAGVMWSPGFDLGGETIELTRSGQQTDGFDLFSIDGDVDRFAGAHARVGIYVTRAVSVEGGVRVARPTLSFSLSGDAESAADETAAERVSHYLFDGSLLFHVIGAAFADRRGVPFLSAGGGYIRELHEGNELVETGRELHATAGVKYWFGRARRVGVRAVAGLSVRDRGFLSSALLGAGDGEDEAAARRTVPLVLVGATFLF